MAGYCERRKVKVASIHWKKCQAGHVQHLDDYYKRLAADHIKIRTSDRKPAKPRPDVSALGTNLRAAIEAATGTAIKCGGCLTYLKSLNRATIHDAKAIVSQLLLNLDPPISIREKYPTIELQREWLTPIVELTISQTPKLDLKKNPAKKTDGRNWKPIDPIDLTDSVRHLLFHLWPMRD